jgi:hypothetical protein
MPLDEESRRLIAQLPLTPHGQALLAYLKEVHEDEDDALRESPNFDPSAGNSYAPFRMGSSWRLNWLLNLPMQAAKELTK